MQKQVKIIGLTINEKFGGLKAVNLKFDENNRLTTIKGEVGSGKTTLQKAIRLTTQGSQTLEDKTLLGDNIDIVAQLLDGETSIFVGCRSKEDGSLDYFLYSVDSNGKKIKDVVIDGQKATPANYLKSLQTALTWRLNELTSENPTVQRNILLELYKSELEDKGVVFDKNHPKYVDGIIDQIEKAKKERDYADMKRKEVGGIASDMNGKGIDYSSRMLLRETKELEASIAAIKASIIYNSQNIEKSRENKLNSLKNTGLEMNQKLRIKKEEIDLLNSPLVKFNENLKNRSLNTEGWCNQIHKLLKDLYINEDLAASQIVEIRSKIPQVQEKELFKTLEFNEKGSCISSPEDFNDEQIKQLLIDYRNAGLEYVKYFESPLEQVDNSKEEQKLSELEKQLEDIKEHNKDALAVNSFFDWKDTDEKVKSFKRDYFMKLTEINTGVEGLYICPEFDIDKDGQRIAKDNDIYLMYDGSYDPEYFHNTEKSLRKLAAYSDTQKPMICLLIQKYLLSKKSKILPYLWIDQVPIDNKTKILLDKMSEELGLWLFVNWTGDFNKENLKDGEILIENGEIFYKEE